MRAITLPESFALEQERYELLPAHDNGLELTRRELLGFAGAGLLMICLMPGADAQESGGRRQRGGFGGGPVPQDIGAWLLVAEDGSITGFTGKVDGGQNSRTSLSQVIAEELRVPITSVTMVMGDTERTPYDMGTFGSRTTPTMVPQIRRAAAAAREALLDLAATQWQVDRALLKTEDGRVLHSPSGKSASYGELSKGQKLTKTIAAGEPVTPVAEWRVEGHPVHKVAGRDIVTGRHQYPSDVKRPGMLCGRIVRPTAFSATLVSLDTSAAEKMPGVQVVHNGDFVGIVAPDQHVATQAADAIQAKWTAPPAPSSAEVFDYLKHNVEPGRDGDRAPSDDFTKVLASADVKLARTYTVAYIAHAPMEPRAAVAEWQDGRLTVWTGTQRPFGVRGELAQAFAIPEASVHVLMPDMGAGYGGKHTGECAIEAAKLAKAAGKPVKLVWTRQEEFTWAYFRPAGVMEVSSGVTRDGRLMAWEFHNYNSGGSGLETPYDVPRKHEVFHSTKYPLRQGSYRGLAATANHFARETHMDELARELKMDAVEFRLKNLKDNRLRAVLQAATQRFGWPGGQRAAGEGIGVSCGLEKGGYVATCAEVAVDSVTGKVRVKRVVESFECGAVINPDQLKNQIEGAVMMALGGALYESIEFANGMVTNPFFSQYRVPRFSDAPVIDVVLVDRKDLPSAGAGETPIVGLAPALSNAIFDATGTRYRAMPMLPKGARAT